jgi:dihydroflavonol-4-reductase
MVLPIVRSAEWFEAKVLRREPTLPSEPVRMATTRMEYDDSRARTELGYSSAPARAALTRAAQWYVDHGFVKPSRVARIRRAGRLGS